MQNLIASKFDLNGSLYVHDYPGYIHKMLLNVRGLNLNVLVIV